MTGPPITVSVEFDRPQDEVFAHVDDPSRFAEWQAGVVGGHMEKGAAVSVGSNCMTPCRIGGAERGRRPSARTPRRSTPPLPSFGHDVETQTHLPVAGRERGAATPPL
jgi:hypothetical protein